MYYYIYGRILNIQTGNIMRKQPEEPTRVYSHEKQIRTAKEQILPSGASKVDNLNTMKKTFTQSINLHSPKKLIPPQTTTVSLSRAAAMAFQRMAGRGGTAPRHTPPEVTSSAELRTP